MTKKDYVRAAKMVKIEKQYWTPSMAAEVIEFLVEFFKENPKFDEEKFRRACGETRG